MDREQLERKLDQFFLAAKKASRPIDEYRLEPVLPGISSSPFVLILIAKWVKDIGYVQALEDLTDIFWESLAEEVRISIFTFKIYSSLEEANLDQKNSVKVAV
jgi:hypothetical protein